MAGNLTGEPRQINAGDFAPRAFIDAMLGWSINLFRIRGIQLAVHVTFFLLLAYVANEGWNEGGLAGLLWSVATLLAFFTCVVLHELGHSFTARRYGIRVPRILLMPIGGMAEFDSIPRRPRHELLITLAGPAVNFAIAAGLWAFVRFPRYWDGSLNLFSFADLLRELFVANLYMGCFNLLPAFPMDGGRILRAVLALRLPYLRATFWAATVGKGVIGLGIAFAFAAPWLHVSEQPLWLLAILFVFIFFAGDAEYRAVRRRDQQETFHREWLARLHQRPPLEEPPVLTR